MTTNVELRVDAHALVGEGPIWDDEHQVLYWVDILSSKLYAYDPARDENRAFDIGQHVGTVVPRASGGVMLAVYQGFAAFDLEAEELTLINDPEADLPGNRFNDGKCDPAGRFWAGTMAYEKQNTQGNLYRLDTDLSVHKMLGGIGISNGLAWSLDHSTMYYIDSPTYTVKAYDYDVDTGNIKNERVIIDVPREVGLPDGMTIDAEGMLWVAHYGGSKICRWHPERGEILQTITLPASQITACAFGDQDLDTLYITSAAQQLTDAMWRQQPQAGGLFSVKPGCQGVRSFKFGG